LNYKEALDLLEVNESSSQEEIKTKYKKLAVKNHPDVNKDPGAEDKFKKINQAFEIAQHPEKADDRKPEGFGSPFQNGFNINDVMNTFFRWLKAKCKKKILFR
jgi:molecular chaperone DnaJ